MAVKEIKLNPGQTWLPLAAVIAIIAALSGILTTVVWFAATQSSNITYLVETVKPMPAAIAQIQTDVAVLKSTQIHIAEQEKNSLGAETIGGDSAPVPLESPARPAWSNSVPVGWTIGPDGKFKEL